MEHILTNNEINEAFEEIRAVDAKIKELTERRNEINQMLTQNAIAVARSKFPGIERGDKVEVTREVYSYSNPGATKTDIGFMGNFFLDHYYGTFEKNREQYLRLELYQIKKDGTRSLRKDDIRLSSIVSIKKVEE